MTTALCYITPREGLVGSSWCAPVLHNIARRTGMPDPEENEVNPDRDAFRHARAPIVQPDALPPGNVVELGVNPESKGCLHTTAVLSSASLNIAVSLDNFSLIFHSRSLGKVLLQSQFTVPLRIALIL